jgi:predicted transposase YbfD/YdcC
MAFLEGVPDPRQARGKQYEWSALLVILAAGLLSGQVTVWGIAEWASCHAAELIQTLAIRRRRIPSASCFYRVLRAVSLEWLAAQVAAFGQQRDAADRTAGTVTTQQGDVLRGQAMDGKDLRGAHGHGARRLVLSLVRHGSGTCLGQISVPLTTNEPGAAPQLLAGRDLQGTVTTTDAGLSHRHIARQILAQRGDYLMVIKKNQPETYAALALLFAEPPFDPSGDDRQGSSTHTRGHGRLETRTLETSALLNGYLDWPGVAQVLRRTCRRVNRRTGEVTTAATYGLTSLSRDRASPAQLEALWRGHWTIENRNHYVRDATFAEDRCQLHVGSAAEALSVLRNAILTLLRTHGRDNLPAACRHYGASPQLALQLIGAIAT